MTCPARAGVPLHPVAAAEKQGKPGDADHHGAAGGGEYAADGLLGGETPETSDTAGLASVRVDNRTDLALDFSGDAYWADTDFPPTPGSRMPW